MTPNTRWVSKPLTRHLADVRQVGVLQRKRCAHPGLLGQIVEAGFGIREEAFGHVKSGVFRQIDEMLEQVAPRGA